MVKMLMEEFGVKNSVASNPLLRTPTAWMPHVLNSFKVNIDVAWDKDLQVAVTAAVVRDHDGTILFSVTRKFITIDSAMHIELLAIRCGVELVLFNDLDNVIVENDSLLAVNEISKREDSMSLWGNIVMDIRGLCNVLGLCSISHI
ncbi:hypothetical protein PTKIN_Ptkin05aG0061000 [Pterospermum kingtungense]